MIKDTPFEGPDRELENLYSSNKEEKVLDEIKNETKENSQKYAIKQIIDFIKSEDKNIFILTGGAGTGKTTIIKEIYNFLIKNQKKIQLTAPTGKATYNLSSRIKNINSEKTSTIFSELYEKYNSVDIKLKDVIFFETKTLDKDVYIVDEAGLIGLKIHKDENQYQKNVLNFGSGSLLKDIIENLGNKTKIIFVGDLFQLLPIGDNKIFALDNNFYQSLNNEVSKNIYLQQNKLDENFDIKTNLNFKIDSVNLTKNYRQENGNGIAINAENIKNGIIKKEYFSLIEENNETFIIKDKTLFIEKLKESYENNQENIIISYTNDSILEYNEFIRDDILLYKNIIEIGEKLIISKNLVINDELFFNGEIIEVVSINGEIENYRDIFVSNGEKTEKIDLKFLEIDVRKNLGNKENIYNLKLCLNTLNSNENGSGEDINIGKFISSFFDKKMKEKGWNIKDLFKFNKLLDFYPVIPAKAGISKKNFLILSYIN